MPQKHTTNLSQIRFQNDLKPLILLGFSVREMCKDEARHGKGYAGLLKRYFEK